MENRVLQPLDKITWIDRERLVPNNYNPNAMAKPELELLKISILESGWTQPIVITSSMEIVDGFHRWSVSKSKELYDLTDGKVPTVTVNDQDRPSQQMATIRHNRARGTHKVLDMSQLVQDMRDEGVSGEEICLRLQMEPEELTRLLFSKGIPKDEIFKDKAFSQAWVPA